MIWRLGGDVFGDLMSWLSEKHWPRNPVTVSLSQQFGVCTPTGSQHQVQWRQILAAKFDNRGCGCWERWKCCEGGRKSVLHCLWYRVQWRRCHEKCDQFLSGLPRKERRSILIQSWTFGLGSGAALPTAWNRLWQWSEWNSAKSALVSVIIPFYPSNWVIFGVSNPISVAYFCRWFTNCAFESLSNCSLWPLKHSTTCDLFPWHTLCHSGRVPSVLLQSSPW